MRTVRSVRDALMGDLGWRVRGRVLRTTVAGPSIAARYVGARHHSIGREVATLSTLTASWTVLKTSRRTMDNATERSYRCLTIEHLDRLSGIAAADRERFYATQPLYRDRHLATALAQGGALHWLDGTTGVKDLDVWSFFALPPEHHRFVADVRHVHTDFGPSELGRQSYDLDLARTPSERAKCLKWSAYAGRRVDLMLRGIKCEPHADPADAVWDWLRAGRPGSSAWWLSQKAVILIDPPDRRGEQVWPMSE